MIKRYSRKQLTDIWSEENKYQIWLDVEVAAAEAMEKIGQIPKGVASVVRKKTKINVKRIHQATTKHHSIAHIKTAFPSALGKTDGIEHRSTLGGDDVRNRSGWLKLRQVHQLRSRRRGQKTRAGGSTRKR